MPDFLHLPNLHTLAAQDMGDHYLVVAEGGVVPTTCPACHNALYRHGSQRQTYLDTPMHGSSTTTWHGSRKRWSSKPQKSLVLLTLIWQWLPRVYGDEGLLALISAHQGQVPRMLGDGGRKLKQPECIGLLPRMYGDERCN